MNDKKSRIKANAVSSCLAIIIIIIIISIILIVIIIILILIIILIINNNNSNTNNNSNNKNNNNRFGDNELNKVVTHYFDCIPGSHKIWRSSGKI